jgi:hypothetical protein
MKKIFLVILIIILGCMLNGCALIGLLLRLAPLAAVLVEYSPPLQIEEGQILCVKALRHVESRGEESRIVRSEYFLVVLDDNGIEVASEHLNVGEEYYVLEEFNIVCNNKNNYALSLPDKNWNIEVKEFTTLCCSSTAEKYENPVPLLKWDIFIP